MQQINTLLKCDSNWKYLTIARLFRSTLRGIHSIYITRFLNFVFLSTKSNVAFLCRITTPIFILVIRVIIFLVLEPDWTLRFFILLTSIIRKWNCSLFIFWKQKIMALNHLLAQCLASRSYCFLAWWRVFFLNQRRLHPF